MARGFFLLYRRTLDHDVFGDESYCKRAAWIWLIERAAFEPARVKVGTEMVSLKRGQLTASIRFLAEAWHWEKTKVIRFLRRLEADGMVRREPCTTFAPSPTPSRAPRSAPPQQLITVCNYDEFQTARQDSAPRTAPPTAPGSESKSHQNGKNINNSSKEDGAVGELFPLNTKEKVAKPLTPQGIVFGACRGFLIAYGGLKDREARSLLGKWIKETSPATVIEVVSEAQARSTPDPVAFIVKGLAARRTQAIPKKGFIP